MPLSRMIMYVLKSDENRTTQAKINKLHETEFDNLRKGEVCERNL